MSSEISTDVHQAAPARAHAGEPGLQPWQLFTLAGLICAAVVAFFASNRPPSVRVALILTVFAAAAIGVAALRALGPLTGRQTMEPSRILGGRTRAALERDKALVLRSLKELEFDRAMGKLSDKDFTEMSARLRARAARILRQLDAGSGYREAIEREIERRVAGNLRRPEAPRAEAPERAAAGSDESAAPEIAAVTALTCAGCSTANDPDARFCKGCGARLEGR